MDAELEAILRALAVIRAPIQRGEYDLHRLVRETLEGAGLPAAHEVPLAPRCRIDLMCGSVGIEMKRGKPAPGRLLPQLTRYCACPEVKALVLVSERSVRLPAVLCGKPVKHICLEKLWGIAL